MSPAIFLPWVVLLAGPPFVLYLHGRFGSHDHRIWLKTSFIGAALIVGSITLNAAGIRFKFGSLSLLWYCALYVAYCFVISASLCIRARLWRNVAVALCSVTLIPGYLLSTIGSLLLGFLTFDVMVTSDRTTEVGDGLVCEEYVQGVAGVSEMETITLYRDAMFPFPLRLQLTSSYADPASDGVLPSCEGLLASLH